VVDPNFVASACLAMMRTATGSAELPTRVIVNVARVWPAGTVTLDGTASWSVALLSSVTVTSIENGR
jgi:hypothetical protein